MNIVRQILFISYSLFAISIPSFGQSEEIQQIITRFFDPKGGYERWMKISSIQKKGMTVGFFNNVPVDTTYFTLTYVAPDKFQMIRIKGGEIFKMTLENGFLLTQHNSDPGQVHTEHIDYLISTLAIVGIEGVFLDTTASFISLGRQLVDGQEYNIISAKRKEWIDYQNYYFDTNTNLLIFVKSAKHRRKDFFKEYRWVGDFLVYTIEESYDESGKLDTRTLYEKIKINENLYNYFNN